MASAGCDAHSAKQRNTKLTSSTADSRNAGEKVKVGVQRLVSRKDQLKMEHQIGS